MAGMSAHVRSLDLQLLTFFRGTILLGYDLYKLLFPKNVDHAAADRFKAFESTDLIGQKFSEVSGTFPRVVGHA